MRKKIIGYALYCLVLVIVGVISLETRDAGAVPYNLTDGSKQSGTMTFNGSVQDSSVTTYNFNGNIQASNQASNVYYGFIGATNMSLTGTGSMLALRVKTITTDPGSTADFKSSTHDSTYATIFNARTVYTEQGIASSGDLYGFISSGQSSLVKSGASNQILRSNGVGSMPIWDNNIGGTFNFVNSTHTSSYSTNGNIRNFYTEKGVAENGDMLGFVGSGQSSLVKSGPTGYVLKSSGIGTMPRWEDNTASTDWTIPGTIGSVTPNTGNFTSLTSTYEYVGESHATTIQVNAGTMSYAYIGETHATTVTANFIGTQQLTVSGAGQSANFVGSTHTTISTAGITVTGGALLSSLTSPWTSFTASGTFITPATSTTSTVYEYVVLAGGGGGGGAAAGGGASGGGAGSMAMGSFTNITPGGTLTITVGAAGTAGTSGTPGTAGGAGGNSSIASGTATVSTITGIGGLGGTVNAGAVGLEGAAGGTIATGGTVNFVGARSDFAWPSGRGGFGGSSMLGWGGRGGISGYTGPGLAAIGFGSGGGGAYEASAAGGAGAPGIVLIRQLTP